MSAYQEGDRVRVVLTDAPAGLYEVGSTGTVIAEGKSGISVQLDHSGKTAMVFDNEVERIYEEPDETQDDGPGELTVWDRYAIAAFQGMLASGAYGHPVKPSEMAILAGDWADLMMELRRGKAT